MSELVRSSMPQDRDERRQFIGQQAEARAYRRRAMRLEGTAVLLSHALEGLTQCVRRDCALRLSTLMIRSSGTRNRSSSPRDLCGSTQQLLLDAFDLSMQDNDLWKATG